MGGEEVYLLLILNLGTRWGQVVSITEPVWTQRLEEKSSSPVGYRTPIVQPIVRHYTD
jgi:hypothetical protein